MSGGHRVAVYARVSTTEQAREGVSLDMQVESAAGYCRALGMNVMHVVRDEGRSGKDLRRPGIEELDRLIERREIDAVAIYKLDRISRSVADFAALLQRYEKRGVSLVSVNDQLDTASASGRLVVNVMLCVSQWEREVIGERTRDALAQLKASGRHLGSPPVGFDLVDGRLMPNERHALVRRAHRLRDQGLTLTAIARAFMADGEVTATGGCRWHPATVARMLKSPVRS